MIPLALSKMGETLVVKRVAGNIGTKKFLESLGFVEGSPVTVISETYGNIIVRVRDSRIAIDRGMANKILVRAFPGGERIYADVKND